MLQAAIREVLEDAADQPVLPRVPTLTDIQALERDMKAFGETSELPVEHLFADGLYARKLFRPAGTLIVGRMHAKRHFYVLLSGEITAWTAHGMKRMQAPQVLITEPGTKRVTYAHTDTVSITFHATDETDLDKIEAAIIVPALLENEAHASALLEMEKPQ